MATSEITARRILVIDDEPFICDAIRMMLKSDGYGVEVANSGKEGLSLLAGGKFDLIIVDYSMPEMRGDELVALIKEQTPNQRIIMITAYAEMLEFSGKPVPGVDLVLCKPFRVGTLREAIVKVLPEG
jgi:CheY-like chemotaxis protein